MDLSSDDMRVPVCICQGISAGRASCFGNCQMRVLVRALCMWLVFTELFGCPRQHRVSLQGHFTLKLEPFFLPKVWETAQDTAGVRWRSSVSAIVSSADKRKPRCRVATSSRLSSASPGICRVGFFCRSLLSSFDGVPFFYLGISLPLLLKLLWVQTMMGSVFPPHLFTLRTHGRVVGWVQGNGAQDAVLANVTKSCRVTAYTVSGVREMCIRSP